MRWPRRGCGCLPGLVTAPAPEALWPRNKLGQSIWVELLLSKFLYGQPTARLLEDWTDRGLPIAQGTVTRGPQRLAPLFEPMLAACRDEVRSAAHWHANETRWEVFEELPGKTGHRWHLWVFDAPRRLVSRFRETPPAWRQTGSAQPCHPARAPPCQREGWGQVLPFAAAEPA